MTDIADKRLYPLIRVASVVRALAALALLSPVIILTDWSVLTQSRLYDFNHGVGSIMILFIVLFPPGWFAMMIVYFANPDRLAAWQKTAVATGGILLLWLLLAIWVPGIIEMARIAFDSGLGELLGSGFGWLVMAIIISGQLMAWITACYTLRSLPPPLGHRVDAY
ncbi:MAG: hypothetical protein DHS20C06_00040 [Hyphobacterium sp.]|nr:MAG: hypothetical protein DHS20C06_00040 [Hyphobacterium sp.]